MPHVNLETAAVAPYTPDAAHARLAGLAGGWRGTARTYLDPSKPPLEASWEGRLAPVLGGRFVRFEYQSRVGDTPHAGELLLAYESGEGQWRTAWIDSFHTSPAILVSVGPGAADAQPIAVAGTYFVGAEHPRWGWRTELDDREPGVLRVRMFNVTPDGQEDLGVDVELRRT